MEGIVERDSSSFAVDTIQQPTIWRRQVGDRESNAVTLRY